jgi:hypothetical protein
MASLGDMSVGQNPISVSNAHHHDDHRFFFGWCSFQSSAAFLALLQSHAVLLALRYRNVREEERTRVVTAEELSINATTHRFAPIPRLAYYASR